MVGQSQIQRRLSQPEGTARVREIIAENPDLVRTQLADRVCDEFGFVDPRARLQRSGCLKALRVLESRGLLSLPAPRTSPGRPQPRRLEGGVPDVHDVPPEVGKVVGLGLVLVRTDEQLRMWNSLLDGHPQGAGPLVGRQLRYLIGSDHGWLGGLGFAAAALHLASRDRWIGWDLERRRAHLDKVVGMSRFLIRSSVRCRNLASHVLGLAVKRMPDDFEARYGYRPLLVETFVDSEQFAGTCYRAANWISVGRTQGRGRQDREAKSDRSIKEVFVWPLEADFRIRLGLSANAGLGPLPLSACLETGDWAEREFDGAPVGDARLSRRLVHSATVQAKNPGLSFPDAAGGDRALVKGHYRFLDQPDGSAVTMENILKPHREQTMRRMKAEKTVLCIQDGTDLNYNGAAECEGLGVIGGNQTGAKSRGLHLHSTLTVTDEGVPLGVLRAQCWAPGGRQDGRSARAVPIEEKETYCWILAMRDCEAVAADMPHTKLVQVMDRAADFLELFDEWRQGARRTDLLVRAQFNRRTTAESKLFDGVRATAPRLWFELQVSRQSRRPKKSKQKAQPGRKARTAQMSLRYQRVELRPPRYLSDMDPLPVWIVHALEEQPPEGKKPIEWFLLTTIELTSPEQAQRVLDWYCLRWRIEDWHRVLKTGCRIEDLRNETAERIKRALAIYLVVAWRIMLMTLLGRQSPDLPCEVLFTDLEIEVLTAIGERRRDLKPPRTLGEAVHLVARLGGYLPRKTPPGHKALWSGNVKLRLLCAGYLVGRQDRERGL